MAWDDPINNLMTSITDMLDEPQTTDEVADVVGANITIPASGAVDLRFAVREPDTTVPQPIEVWVNNIKYSRVDRLQDLAGNTFYVNWAASRIRFATSEVGKQITKCLYQNWGTQNRGQHLLDAYNAIKLVRDTGKSMLDALAADANLQVTRKANNVSQLTQLYPPAQYVGARGYANGEVYVSTGTVWKKLETVTSSDPVPQVAAVDPAPGATGVSSDYDPVTTFTDNMAYGDVSVNITLKDKDGNVVTVTKQYLDKNDAVISSPGAGTTNIRKVKLVTANNLTIAGSPYTIEVLPCENIVGRAMAATFTSQFTCAADMLPTPATISAVNGTVTGTSVQIQLDTAGSDFEGPVHYAIMARDLSGTDPNIGASFQILTGYESLYDADFPKTVNGLTKSTGYEFKVRTYDNAGQYQDSNVITVNTPNDSVPPAPTAPEVTNLSTTGYRVRLATANQVTDPDNPEATITYDIADGTTSNIVATGKTGAQMDAGVDITAAHSAGTNVSVYVRAVSSTSGAGPWSAATIQTVPTNTAPTATIDSMGTGAASRSFQVTLAGIGAGDSAKTVRIGFRLTTETVAQAETAGRYQDFVTGLPTAAPWTFSGTSTTALTGGTAYVPFVKVEENMSGGGTQWGSATEGTQFTAQAVTTLREETFQSTPANVVYIQRNQADTQRNIADIGNAQRARYDITQGTSGSDIVKGVCKFEIPSAIPTEAEGTETVFTLLAFGIWQLNPDYTLKHLAFSVYRDAVANATKLRVDGAFFTTAQEKQLASNLATGTTYRLEIDIDKVQRKVTRAQIINDGTGAVVDSFATLTCDNNLTYLDVWQPNKVDFINKAWNTDCTIGYDSTNKYQKSIFGADQTSPYSNAQVNVKYFKVTEE